MRWIRNNSNRAGVKESNWRNTYELVFWLVVREELICMFDIIVATFGAAIVLGGTCKHEVSLELTACGSVGGGAVGCW